MLTQFHFVHDTIQTCTSTQNFRLLRRKKAVHVRAGGLLLGLLLALFFYPHVVYSQAAAPSIDDAIRSVVRIRVCHEGDCEHSFGSGVVIHPSGVILTARHLTFDGTEDDNARLAPQARYRARLVAISTEVEDDLAVLQIYGDATTGADVDRETLNLPYLKLADTRTLQIGEQLQVLGYPGAGGLAINYTEHPLGGFGNDGNAFKIQATISPGNSGGPALVIRNGRYEIAGITSFRLGDFGEVTWFINISQIRDLLWNPSFPRVWAEDIKVVATGQGASATVRVEMDLNMIDFVDGRGEAALLLFDAATEEAWYPPASTTALELLDDGQAIIRGSFSAADTIVVDQPFVLDPLGGTLGISPDQLTYALLLVDPQDEEVLSATDQIRVVYADSQTTATAPEPYAVLNGPVENAISGKQTFSWSAYNLPLAENQAYSVVFWDPKLGETPLEDGYAPTGFVRSTSVEIDLDQVIDKLPEVREKNYYHWGVILIQTSPSFKRLAYLGGDHKFWLTRSSPQSSNQSSTQSSVQPTPIPTVAPLPTAVPPTLIATDPSSWTVAPQSGDFSSIQRAVDSVPAGSTLYIRPGIYRENIIIEKTVHLIGDGNRDDIVIIGTDYDEDITIDEDTILFAGESGTLRNLTLHSDTDFETAYAVNVVAGHLLIEECDITSDAGGVRVGGGATPTVRNNQIHDALVGLFIYNGSSGLFEGNDIYENFIAVGVEDNGNPTMRFNRISDNAVGILISDNSQGIYERNDIYGNIAAGIGVDTASTPIVRNNRISQNKAQGIVIADGGGGTYTGNDLTNNKLGPWKVEDAGVIDASGNTPNDPQ